MAQNIVNPYFVDVVEEEEDDYEEIAAEYLEQFPPQVPRVFTSFTCTSLFIL